MLRRSLVMFLVATPIAALAAPGKSTTAQPTLTPQSSGTTSGLIAVSPVNPQVVWASGASALSS